MCILLATFPGPVLPAILGAPLGAGASKPGPIAKFGESSAPVLDPVPGNQDVGARPATEYDREYNALNDK